jgi:hypothetical protein
MGSFSFEGSNEVSTESITNDGFFPAVSIAIFQQSYRLPLDYSVDVITRELIMSIAHTNKELSEWRETQAMATLAEVDADKSINGEHLLTHFYLSAVYSHAKAELINNFSTMQRDEGTKNTLEDSPRIRSALKRDFNKALSFFDIGIYASLI